MLSAYRYESDFLQKVNRAKYALKVLPKLGLYSSAEGMPKAKGSRYVHMSGESRDTFSFHVSGFQPKAVMDGSVVTTIQYGGSVGPTPWTTVS
jgi:hypothetical protein